MKKDYETKDLKLRYGAEQFKFRVAGIIKNGNKILLDKINKNDFLTFPGGHVEIMENTACAIERELNEELYFKVKVDKLLFIHENIVKTNRIKLHEICFYYLASPVDEVNFEPVNYEEDDHGHKTTHYYRWISEEDLYNQNIKPENIVRNFLEGYKGVHIISEELE